MNTKQAIKILEELQDFYFDHELDAIIHAIEVMRASEWISMNDKKPKVNTQYDVWSKSLGLCSNMHFEKRGKDNQFFSPVFCGHSCVRDATHYRHSPQPPQGEE